MAEPSELNGSDAAEGALDPRKRGGYVFLSHRGDDDVVVWADDTGTVKSSIEIYTWLMEMAGYKLYDFHEG